ncbi:MAG: ribonuclease P protein component [Bacteroidales bacterium]|jgi:ribonuclease P protein component|nr:ribonuclease P protein component [Bacteroidales bacterium]
MPKKYGLSRSEKLKSVVRTEKLFTKGKSFRVFPFSVYFRLSNDGELTQNQFLVSVGKHYFKHAVDRNRMKRLVREAYRKNKLPLYEKAKEKNVFFNLGFVYRLNVLSDFKTVEAAVKNALLILSDKIEAF